MTVFDTKTGLPAALANGPGEGASLVVVCFCAAWCDTCGAFREAFERIAAARPRAIFVWLDIENFPTLAVYRGERLLHYGVSLPQEGTVGRLVDELATRTDAVADAPRPVLDLPRAVARTAR